MSSGAPPDASLKARINGIPLPPRPPVEEDRHCPGCGGVIEEVKGKGRCAECKALCYTCCD